MRKTTYLCVMMLLSMNMMAQIDLNDSNWRRTFYDDFTVTGRSWHNWQSYPDKKWMGYPGSGVTTTGGFQVYQYSNCIFSPNDGTMKLVGEYCDTICRNTYPLPGWMHGNYPPCDNLFYFSGGIDARRDSIIGDTLGFRYGFFEIRCKLPKNPGTHTAFWLHGADTAITDPYYEEIDIFEYSWSFGDPEVHYHPVNNPHPTFAGDPRVYTLAVCHNQHGDSINFDTDVYGMKYIRIPSEQEDIGGWHTYSCEWLPDHVFWYLDGNLVSAYFDQTHIPRHPITLKTSYAINHYAVEAIKDSTNHVIGYEPDWMGSDTLTIDYVRVYQLEWDCDTEEVIASQNDLDQYEYAVKKSVTIAPPSTGIAIGNTDKVTFRATNFMKAAGPFEVQSGGEFTVIMQECPD